MQILGVYNNNNFHLSDLLYLNYNDICNLASLGVRSIENLLEQSVNDLHEFTRIPKTSIIKTLLLASILYSKKIPFNGDIPSRYAIFDLTPVPGEQFFYLSFSVSDEGEVYENFKCDWHNLLSLIDYLTSINYTHIFIINSNCLTDQLHKKISKKEYPQLLDWNQFLKEHIILNREINHQAIYNSYYAPKSKKESILQIREQFEMGEIPKSDYLKQCRAASKELHIQIKSLICKFVSIDFARNIPQEMIAC